MLHQNEGDPIAKERNPSWREVHVPLDSSGGVCQLRFRVIVYWHLSSPLYGSRTWPVLSEGLPCNPYNNTLKAGVTPVLQKKREKKGMYSSRPPSGRAEDHNWNHLSHPYGPFSPHCSVFPTCRSRSKTKMDKFCRSHTHETKMLIWNFVQLSA